MASPHLGLGLIDAVSPQLSQSELQTGSRRRSLSNRDENSRLLSPRISPLPIQTPDAVHISSDLKLLWPNQKFRPQFTRTQGVETIR